MLKPIIIRRLFSLLSIFPLAITPVIASEKQLLSQQTKTPLPQIEKQEYLFVGNYNIPPLIYWQDSKAVSCE